MRRQGYRRGAGDTPLYIPLPHSLGIHGARLSRVSFKEFRGRRSAKGETLGSFHATVNSIFAETGFPSFLPARPRALVAPSVPINNVALLPWARRSPGEIICQAAARRRPPEKSPGDCGSPALARRSPRSALLSWVTGYGRRLRFSPRGRGFESGSGRETS